MLRSNFVVGICTGDSEHIRTDGLAVRRLSKGGRLISQLTSHFVDAYDEARLSGQHYMQLYCISTILPLRWMVQHDFVQDLAQGSRI
jgi:hypothetical protein